MKLNIRSILSAAATIAGTLNPGVGVVIGIVNQLLPKEKQLPITATGQDCEAAISGLPTDQQAEIYSQEIDLEMAKVESHTTIQTAMLEADKVGASTRPDIAMMFAVAILLVELPIAWGLTYQAFTSDNALEELKSCWPIILAMVVPLVSVSKTYFGNRQEDKRMRHAMAHGHPIPSQALGLIGKLLK